MKFVDQQADRSQSMFTKIMAVVHNAELAAFISKNFSAFGEKNSASSDKFADPVNRLFPMDTAANAALSKLYFDYQRKGMPQEYASKIADKIKTMLQLHGLPFGMFPSFQEKTATVQFYHLMDGIPEVSSAEELVQAGSAFEAQHTKLAMMDRVSFSKGFMKVAREFGLKEFPKSITKYAACLDTDLNNVRSMLEYRALAATREGKDGCGYTKLAGVLEKVGSVDSAEALEKLAWTIHSIDEQLGFDAAKYDRKFPDSFGVVFCKQAEDTDSEDDQPSALTKAQIVQAIGEDGLQAVTLENGDINQEKAAKLIKRFTGEATA